MALGLQALHFGFWTLVFGIKVKVFAKAQRPWTLEALEFAFWNWDFGFWSLDSELWIFHFALWLSDFGILVFGLCALD